MKRSRFNVIRDLTIILLFLIIIFAMPKSKIIPSSSPDSNLQALYLVNSSFKNEPINRLFKNELIDSSFKNELINERLASHSQLYNNSVIGCNNAQPPTAGQQVHLSALSTSLIKFRGEIVSYPNEYFQGRGIVLTVGPQQLDFAKVNLKMIEHSGTRLPVQIWYSSTQISHESMVNLLNEAPTVHSSICCFDTNQCRTRTKMWQLNPTHVYKPKIGQIPKHFPYKPAAIISATFAEVLFLDSDAYVTRDPEELFLFDPMYLKFGALFYPDPHKSRQLPGVWKVLKTSCGEQEYELDSAAILVDKKRVWNGLFMTKIMNDNHALFYQTITDGDKDTFRLGFRYMDVKYYIVTIPCASGTYDGNRFCGRTLCKTDSLGQHIYINHVHIFKYEGISYTPDNLAYTRIGLGDPYNNSFLFDHCRIEGERPSCFHIVKRPNPRIVDGKCYPGQIPSEEIEDFNYSLHKPLLFERSRNNRALLTKTANVMPNFVDNLLQYF